MTQKVGRDKIQVLKDRSFTYKDIIYDDDGWADARKYLPADFDLVHLRLKDGTPNLTGWHTGKEWEGLRIKEQDEVTFWKRKLDENQK
jgi:hypothetical protein